MSIFVSFLIVLEAKVGTKFLSVEQSDNTIYQLKSIINFVDYVLLLLPLNLNSRCDIREAKQQPGRKAERLLAGIPHTQKPLMELAGRGESINYVSIFFLHHLILPVLVSSSSSQNC